ncbi:unnamed protein product [Spirodela intermedia]|uniref:Uncharacterized protein n=1 Tax=Spirodela intermedia TaxID=51605 RepID=A0A7I8I9M6_SPIIN|nr:unnamed protein product [Spirodela intermedia]CAA6654290.1 unnamed protein product [Spirodela intermedia]
MHIFGSLLVTQDVLPLVTTKL